MNIIVVVIALLEIMKNDVWKGILTITTRKEEGKMLTDEFILVGRGRRRGRGAPNKDLIAR